MKCCDPRSYDYSPSWGGHLGDMALHSICDWFNQVKIHRTCSRTVAEFPGKRFVEIRDNKSPKCCAKHEKQAEILRVAQYKEAIQTQSLPVLDKNNLDPFARAFILARKQTKSLN